MKRIIFWILACVLCTPLTTFALSREPQSVWFTPIPNTDGTMPALKSGDPIRVYAQVDNQTKDPITYTLSFTANKKNISTKTTTVLGYTEQATSIQWIMPEASTSVMVVVTKAVDKNKKELKDLEVVIGTITIGAVVEPALPELGGVKGFFGKYLALVESWRIRQMNSFSHIQTQSKREVGDITIADVTNYLQPETPTAPGQSPNPKPIDDGHSKVYLTFLWGAAGEYFFGHKALFYIVSILLVLFVVRFIVRRFR